MGLHQQLGLGLQRERFLRTAGLLAGQAGPRLLAGPCGRGCLQRVSSIPAEAGDHKVSCGACAIRHRTAVSAAQRRGAGSSPHAVFRGAAAALLLQPADRVRDAQVVRPARPLRAAPAGHPPAGVALRRRPLQRRRVPHNTELSVGVSGGLHARLSAARRWGRGRPSRLQAEHRLVLRGLPAGGRSAGSVARWGPPAVAVGTSIHRASLFGCVYTPIIEQVELQHRLGRCWRSAHPTPRGAPVTGRCRNRRQAAAPGS